MNVDFTSEAVQDRIFVLAYRYVKETGVRGGGIKAALADHFLKLPKPSRDEIEKARQMFQSEVRPKKPKRKSLVAVTGS